MAHCGRAGLKRGVNPSQGAMPFTWPCPPARSPFASVAAVEAGLLLRGPAHVFNHAHGFNQAAWA